MDDLKSLAADVLAMFEAQREYFKTKNPERLTQCKQIEAALKRRCKAIVDPPETPAPGLFDFGGES